MEWSVQSSDLNPPENIWHHLERQISKKNNKNQAVILGEALLSGDKSKGLSYQILIYEVI